MTSFLRFALCALLIASPAGADEPTAKLVGGEAFAAELVGIDAAWNVTFQTADGQRTIAGGDLQHWGALREREGRPLVLLAGGGVLATEVLDITRSQIIIKPRLWEQVGLPLEHVRGIIFRPPADALRRDRLLFHIQQATGAQDELLLNNGDRIAGGLVQAAGDPLEPSFRLETKSDEFTVPRTKVVAVTFNPALVDAPKSSAPAAWIGMRDGSLLAVERVSVAGNRLEMKLTCGVTLRTFPGRINRLWSDFEFLQPASPRLVYLSDLEPLANGYKPVPFLETDWPYAADRNVLGGRLRAAGEVHLKGIGMHSASRLAYALDGSYQHFEAELAIDDLAGQNGSVQFQVVTSKGEGWQTQYKSEIVRGGDAPLPIRVDIQGVRGLVLLVSFADRGDVWDHANWLNARVVK